MMFSADLYKKVFTSIPSKPICKLCQNTCDPFDVVDFGKFCNADPYANGFSGIPVYYFRCIACECTFTNFFDNWSSEDFSTFVYNEEYCLVDPDYVSIRPEATAQEWSNRFAVIKPASVLDFGAGSGRFALAMNACGFDFQSYDPFSSPELPKSSFDIVTAFEVVEHSPDPLKTFETVFDFMGERKIVIVGQSIQPSDIMSIRGNWWYIAPRNGHCTVYSEKSFREVANRFGLSYVPSAGLHGFFSHPDDELTASIIRCLVGQNS
jgi:hypothetical protein